MSSTVSDAVLHPDRVVASSEAGVAAFVVAPSRDGNKDQAGIWLGPLAGAPSRVTEEVPATNLALRADGSALAYAVRSEDGVAELVVRALGGGTEQRTALVGYPERVAWAPDGPLLVLVAEPGADSASLTSGKPLTTAAEITVLSTADPVGWRRLWSLDEGELRLVSPEAFTVWEFTALPGGEVVAIGGNDPTEAGWYRPVLTVLGPTPADRRDLHRPAWQISSPTVSPDGTTVAFLEGWTSDRGLHTGDLRFVPFAGGAVTEGPALGADATWLRYTSDGRLWFAGWLGLGTGWGWVEAGSPRLHRSQVGCLNGPWHPEVVPLAGDEALTVRSSLREPPEVWHLDGDADPSSWSAVNPVAERAIRVRELHWKHEADELEGLLIVPDDGTDGPWPLVVDIHGGPTVAYHHSWDLLWGEPLTAAGYAVLLPNPIGGPGRGQTFAQRNLGDPAGVEFEQVLAAVAHCVDTGVTTAGRVAAIGASYGGYLTAWAVARGDVFSCGIVIAGISDLTSCWGTANNSPFYDFLCQGTPRDGQPLYVQRSPVTVLGAQSVPALILHGELDQCVPAGQARELFTGLRDAGVAAELVVYPGEGHQTQRIEHLYDQRERIVAFLGAHL